MLTTGFLLVAFIAIGFFARNYSRRIQLVMLGACVIGVVLLIRS